mgnify:CR=1 FL=1
MSLLHAKRWERLPACIHAELYSKAHNSIGVKWYPLCMCLVNLWMPFDLWPKCCKCITNLIGKIALIAVTSQLNRRERAWRSLAVVFVLTYAKVTRVLYLCSADASAAAMWARENVKERRRWRVHFLYWKWVIIQVEAALFHALNSANMVAATSRLA